jgi:two-component system OmpR family response regulator
MRLLLVEDDAETAAEVRTALVRRGHDVDVAVDGLSGRDRAIGHNYDAVIVDRMLPGLDGLTLLAALRSGGLSVPILLLTALGSVADRVEGLKLGADDYLVKPFSMAELEARVEALGRRALFAAASLTVDDLVLDRLAREVRRGGVLVELQPREFQILELLMLNSPVVVTRRMLLEKVFRFRFDPGTNLVESHVSRLRS